MGFERMGMHGAQPTFQTRPNEMVPAKELCIFEVCPEAESADDPRVYRQDIIGFKSADARLIAAAPDLLAALEECADALEEELAARYLGLLDYPSVKADYDIDMEAVQRARAAIAKAKGEAQ